MGLFSLSSNASNMINSFYFSIICSNYTLEFHYFIGFQTQNSLKPASIMNVANRWEAIYNPLAIYYGMFDSYLSILLYNNNSSASFSLQSY